MCMWQHDADAGNLRRSTRKRRVLVHVDYASDESEHEVYHRSQTTRVRIARSLRIRSVASIYDVIGSIVGVFGLMDLIGYMILVLSSPGL